MGPPPYFLDLEDIFVVLPLRVDVVGELLLGQGQFGRLIHLDGVLSDDVVDIVLGVVGRDDDFGAISFHVDVHESGEFAPDIVVHEFVSEEVHPEPA